METFRPTPPSERVFRAVPNAEHIPGYRGFPGGADFDDEDKKKVRRDAVSNQDPMLVTSWSRLLDDDQFV